MIGFGRVVRRTRRGDFEVRIGEDEREMLRNVVGQLGAMLDGDLGEPTMRRLFPTAYTDDEARDREYQQLARDTLADRRRASVATVLATVDATRLAEDELLAWMSAVNDLRLVLGTRLDVSEDMDPAPDPGDPDSAWLAVYGYLGYLLESIVDALSD